MYKIESVRIDGFWYRFGATCSFNSDVNIIIGRNGTGKTTFMNILYSVLTVEPEGLLDNDFVYIDILLVSENDKKLIKAKKVLDENSPYLLLEYFIDDQVYELRLVSPDDRRYSPMHFRRKMQEVIEEIKSNLSKFVSLSSLSVYRLRNGQDYEIRDSRGSRLITPVDFRLEELLSRLTHFQLNLSQEARNVSTALQKEVLTSILYTEEDAEQRSYDIQFDKDNERRSLISAFQQLNSMDADVRKKITFHVNAIEKSVNELKAKDSKSPIDFASLEALRKTQKIIRMSLRAEEKITGIFSQIHLFLKTLKDFIIDKDFTLESGTLKIVNESGVIDVKGLSSGEKQLLILFIETLLQNRESYIFLTDEPELSLHVSWQRKIIPAIKSLNPNAQIIAATHSPEVASLYPRNIHDMEKIINE